MITALKALRILREMLNSYASVNNKDVTANLLISLLDAMATDIESDHRDTIKKIDTLTNEVGELRRELNFKNCHVQELNKELNDQLNEVRKLQNTIKETTKTNDLINKEIDAIKKERTILREEISLLKEYIEECDCQ